MKAKEFTATGTLTLEGVVFYIKARSLDGAWVRMRAGDYDSFDTSTAEVVNSHVDLDTLEEHS